MTAMTVTITKKIDADELMSAVFDNIVSYYSSWVESYSYKHGDREVIVTYLNEEEETKARVDVYTLVKVYEEMYGTECWGQTVNEVGEWDCLVADSMLQRAVFGEEVYA
jgi:hypothetical protein